MRDERRSHLDELSPTLWPPPHTAVVGRRGAGQVATVEEFLLLPNVRRPRLLTPTGRRTAAAVVRHYGEGRTPRARMASAVLALALRAGLGSLLRRRRLVVTAPPTGVPESLLDHLRRSLGRDAVMGMHLGPPRANRKPVIQLLSPAGETLAYAKVAVDDLTDALVRTEAGALTRLAAAGTRVVQVARVEHCGSWQGRSVLVQTALPVWLPRSPLTGERHLAAVAEVAGIGRRDDVPLRDSDHWHDLQARLDRLPEGEATTELRTLVRRLGDAAAGVPLSFGASHGDWTPWNMANLEDRLLVWDWERFRLGVPLGFDLLHHAQQTDLVTHRREPREAARRSISEAGECLRPLGVPPRAALVTAVLYGADLAGRYLADGQLEAGARLGDVGAWLLPALHGGIHLLEGKPK